MGFLFGSSEEDVEMKTVDSNGNISNNIIIREADDMHSVYSLVRRVNAQEASWVPKKQKNKMF